MKSSKGCNGKYSSLVFCTQHKTKKLFSLLSSEFIRMNIHVYINHADTMGRIQKVIRQFNLRTQCYFKFQIQPLKKTLKFQKDFKDRSACTERLRYLKTFGLAGVIIQFNKHSDSQNVTAAYTAIIHATMFHLILQNLELTCKCILAHVFLYYWSCDTAAQKF